MLHSLQDGKYAILKELGGDGFSITYEAFHTRIGKRVAIKEFSMSDFCLHNGDDANVDDKSGEKRTQLSHPHIVSVSEYFEENGTAYCVMDYIEGENLAEHLHRTNKPIGEANVLDILHQVLDALSYIHGQNPPQLHLNINPTNLIRMSDGNIVLIDFGANKWMLQGDGHRPATFTFTPGFTPIEQMDQDMKNIGPWTDFYSLGATLYNLLTNRWPPRISDIINDNTMDKHLSIPLPDDLSPMMKKLILWMMTLRSIDRPKSVKEIRDFISQCKGGDNLDPQPDELVNTTLLKNDLTASQMYVLGNDFFHGRNGKTKDYAEAVKWYRKSAELGNEWGQNALGYMYRNGYGVTKDYAEAVKWYRKAAEQGNADGQNNLGYMYELTRNYAQALNWYRKAAEQGCAASQLSIGYMYFRELGVDKDYVEAVKWYRKAAMQGNAGECRGAE